MSKIIENLPADEYHAHPAISRSALEKVDISLEHYYDKYLAEDADAAEKEESPALAFGRAFHSYLLEPEVFRRDYVILPEDAPKKPTKSQLNAKKLSDATQEIIAWWNNFYRENEGKVIQSHKDHQTLVAMAQKVEKHPKARELFTGDGKNEVSIFWTDKETGIECKARFDRLVMKKNGVIIVDPKTSQSAAPEDFKRNAYNYGYHTQTAFYWDGFKQVFGFPPAGFVNLVFEKTRPFTLSCFEAEDGFIQAGRARNRENLRKLAEARTTGHYPGYSDDFIPLCLPEYVEKRLINQGVI